MAVQTRDIIRQLPSLLQERCRQVGADVVQLGGDFVLYWMHSALRDHDNPALDVALLAAQSLKCPVIVYSDIEAKNSITLRQAYFQFQNVREAHNALRKNNINAFMTFCSDGKPHINVARLMSMAKLMITETSPIPNLVERTAVLAQLRHNTPIITVDSTCIIPSTLLDDITFNLEDFRAQTVRLRKERFGKKWPHHCDFPKEIYHPPVLPFTPLDANAPEALAEFSMLPFDSSVPLATMFAGGSKAAYELWLHFKQKSMRFYPKQQQNPYNSSIASLLPYLRYGVVSPFRLLEEALADNSDGAWLFINFAFIERELSYHFVENAGQITSLKSLPSWAIASVENHRADERANVDSKLLYIAETPSNEWNSLHNSFQKSGVLHELGRLFWAKSLFTWIKRPEDYRRIAQKLYQHYALDGDDPVSLCLSLRALGLFDDEPENNVPKPIFGSIPAIPVKPPESLVELTTKLQRYDTRIEQRKPKVAVIGAGMAGLTCATMLKRHNISVTVFDKGRAIGGRMTTKIINNYRFDIGAPFLKPNNALFKDWIAQLSHDKVIKKWDARVYSTSAKAGLNFNESPHVGLPSMDSIIKYYAQDCDVRCSTTIQEIDNADGGWRLTDKDGMDCGFFDVVVLAIPAPQAVPLLNKVAIKMAAHINQKVEMLPTWVVMIAFNEPLAVTFDMGAFGSSILRYAIRNSSKPNRPKSPDCWVFYATTEWSETNLELSDAQVVKALASELTQHFGVKLPTLAYASAHRWRYAHAAEPLGTSHLYENGIGVCGDWCLGRRIEDAFTSGQAMAGRVALELAQKANK
jgi:predicted NAD/FAD-dependent oxidoreductase/deoxyribodipyrimidine photolyase